MIPWDWVALDAEGEVLLDMAHRTQHDYGELLEDITAYIDTVDAEEGHRAMELMEELNRILGIFPDYDDDGERVFNPPWWEAWDKLSEEEKERRHENQEDL